MRKRVSNQFNRLVRLLSSNVYMLLVVFLVSASLLLMNYYTIKLLSGARAYINGESHYSKGQKDASRYLIMYLDTENDQYWQEFNKHLSVPIGDKRARVSLLQGDFDQAEEGFLDGANHPADIEVMIWLFTNFQDISFMSDPIRFWTKGDLIVAELKRLGEEIRVKIQRDEISESYKQEMKLVVHQQSTALTELEAQFLSSLGTTSRKISKLLLFANTLLIIALVGGASIFSMRIIHKLIRSEEMLLQRNKELKNTNRELDRFVYSASHDLRAPITSLKGLINIARTEKNDKELQQYFNLMEVSLEKQDKFIRKIISFSKNKRTELNIEKVNLNTMINEILAQYKFIAAFSNMEVRKHIAADEFYTDSTRLEIVLSNLLSNAIKYSDMRKKRRFVEISSSMNENILNLTIADNGIGIDASSKDRIFEMFYMTRHSEDGTGVGLYIVKETVEKLKGTITVESTKDVGAEFKILIPVKTYVSDN